MKKAWIKLDDKQWLFDEESWTLAEWFVLKNVTGLSRVPFLNGLLEEDPYALQGLVWFLRTRDGEPRLRLEEVDFHPSRLDWDEFKESDAIPPSVGAEAPTTSKSDETTTSTSSPAGSDSQPEMSTP